MDSYFNHLSYFVHSVTAAKQVMNFYINIALFNFPNALYCGEVGMP